MVPLIDQPPLSGRLSTLESATPKAFQWQSALPDQVVSSPRIMDSLRVMWVKLIHLILTVAGTRFR
jgi:hypothetical protein